LLCFLLFLFGGKILPVSNALVTALATPARAVGATANIIVSRNDDLPDMGKRRCFQPALDEERRTKRNETPLTLDGDNNDLTNGNVLLPLKGLLCFTETNFCCKCCHKSLKRCPKEQQPVPPLGLEVFGIAFGLNFHCACGVKTRLRHDLVPSAADKVETLKLGQPFATGVNAGDFMMNRRLQLGLQLSGDGRQEGKIIMGMLNINLNPMKSKWTEVQDLIGEVMIDVGNEVLEEYLHIECMLSPAGEGGRRALDVASDTRWDKQGSTRRCDSLSGCSVAFGCRSELPIGIEVMSSICIKCKKGHPHDSDVSPKNCAGSAKGMEAAGAAKYFNRLFLNEEDPCHILHLVTDNNSLVGTILTHSRQDLIDSLQWTIDDWPRHANGKKKPNNGLLPILHKGHHTRGCIHVCFAEAGKSKKDGCECTKMDAERMKRRMS
jgi:hypothetical protein